MSLQKIIPNIFYDDIKTGIELFVAKFTMRLLLHINLKE